jgi:hypothetical protein
VNANSPVALGASPPRRLRFDKFPYAGFPDIFQIFDHAHAVVGPVSFIQMFQGIAGNLVAFKTVFCITFTEKYTGFYFTSDPRHGLFGIISSAPGAFVLFPQISHANSAVHSAGCD